MVPNIDCTMGHKIKTRKPPRHETQCVIPYSLPKYLKDTESVKTEHRLLYKWTERWRLV